MNTQKVVKAMAEAMNVTPKRVEDPSPEDLAGYDLIGFGSGMYAGRYYKYMVNLIEKVPEMEKEVFLFHTAWGLTRSSTGP